jgi:MGT family glycosyltransferase
MAKPARILGAMFQGGGNVPLIMPIMTRLVERGHSVRIMVGPGVRPSRLSISPDFLRRISAAGATLVPFGLPVRHPLDAVPPAKGVVGSWVPAGFKSLPGEARTGAWAPSWALQVAEELRTTPADVVVADFVLLGAFAAAEAAGVPSVALMHTVAQRPLPGVPPYGPGWLPAHGPLGHARDAVGRAIVGHVYRRNALPALNDARGRLGLPPLRSPFAQYDLAARVLMLVSAAFDYPGRRSPVNMRHVGTPIEDGGVTSWVSPWPASDRRPLIVVSLSTLNQGQAPLMRRILLAVAAIKETRVLVTLGPALEPAEFSIPSNVRVERFVPHSAVLPDAAVMVTQCGLGTVAKAMACGVPLLCIPLLGDQPDNAARVVARGAGIRIDHDVQPKDISVAIRRLLTEPSFRKAASTLAATLRQEKDPTQRATNEIEAVSLAVQ